jgi:hypothetical protein
LDQLREQWAFRRETNIGTGWFAAAPLRLPGDQESVDALLVAVRYSDETRNHPAVRRDVDRVACASLGKVMRKPGFELSN